MIAILHRSRERPQNRWRGSRFEVRSPLLLPGGCACRMRALLVRGGAVWQLVGLITRRSQVQILPPLPIYRMFPGLRIRPAGFIVSLAATVGPSEIPGYETTEGGPRSLHVAALEGSVQVRHSLTVRSLVRQPELRCRRSAGSRPCII